MINTYTESPLIRIAKLSIADSFYLEGGSKSLAQAEVEYRDWREFFPEDELADDVTLKMAEIHLRQVMAHNQDTTHAKIAERTLQELLRRYPSTDKKELVGLRMAEVQEILAMHELGVARFYFDLRSQSAAAQMRTEEILNKYPNFSRFDEALFLHAKAMAEQEDTETASRDLARIITSYPHSQYRKQAEALLKKWEKEVPEPDPAKLQEPPPDNKGLTSRMVSAVFGPKIETSKTGIIIDKNLKTDEIVARAAELSGTRATGPVTPAAGTTTNAPDARPRRASGASQDVEVKPGSSTEKDQDKNKKDNKKEKKPEEPGPKGLRNSGSN